MTVTQMGVTKDGNVREFIGNSADTKPTTNIGAGSTFFEANTYRKNVWTGTSWVLYEIRDYTSTIKYSSLATTNLFVIASTPYQLTSLLACNMASTTRYLKLYDKTTVPNLASDIPFITYTISPYQTISLVTYMPIKMVNGISIAITGGASDSDTTVIGANEVKVVATIKA